MPKSHVFTLHCNTAHHMSGLRAFQPLVLKFEGCLSARLNLTSQDHNPPIAYIIQLSTVFGIYGLAVSLRRLMKPKQELVYGVYAKLSLPDPRSIRLLTILPGKPGDVIECSLEVVNLDKKPRYNALSYVWGPQVRLSRSSAISNISKSLPNCVLLYNTLGIRRSVASQSCGTNSLLASTKGPRRIEEFGSTHFASTKRI
jgi:hypothetical protein